MAELREISDGKDLQFAGSYETTDVLPTGGKDAEEVNNSGVDVLGEEETIDAEKEVQEQDINEDVVFMDDPSAHPCCLSDSETIEDVQTLDFGRDTNRLDYFRVTPFDVFGDDNHANYGGGGGNRRNLGIEVTPGFGDMSRQEAVGISSNNVRSGGYNGRSGSGDMIIQNFEQERATGNGIRIRRRIRRAPRVPNRRDGSGWSAKRIRCFRTTPFDVLGNDNLRGIVDLNRTPEVPVEISSNASVAGDGDDVNGGGEEGGWWEKWWLW